MPFTSKDTAETQDYGQAVDRTAHLDDYTVNIVSIRETHSLKDALAGLPNGQCHCPHWGYLLAGRMSVDYGDRQEEYAPGDAFYMSPGHVPTADAGSEFVIFSPTEELKETEEAIMSFLQNA
jgi:mannose-6-phosphate isomerase-like protein (cupin superfamily)